VTGRRALSPNESCPCGSGLKFKNCCGRLPQSSPRVAHSTPHDEALPFENCGFLNPTDPFERSIVDLIRRGNLPQAEILLRDNIARHGNSANALNCLGWIAAAVGLPEPSMNYFAQAADLAPSWQHPRANAAQVRRGARMPQKSGVCDKSMGFLLIKAWGFGFWSDVNHVIGQLLIAELTGRIPIVHWGANSLFWDGTLPNAFEAYFEPVSTATLDDLRDDELRVWPPKWNHRNLLDGEVDKWSAPFSRLAGLYLLGRQERIVVSDFFSSVFDLKPWIPKDSDLYSMSIDDLHVYLVQKYLRPKPQVLQAVTVIYESRLAAEEFIAVHARGSDKAREMGDLDMVNSGYRHAIEEFRSRHGARRIFLMTDDSRLRDFYLNNYGDDVVCTDCQRTDCAEGVHYQSGHNRRQLGIEVMVDVYLAIHAKAFVGNGFSNPSLMVRYLKTWPKDHVTLIGHNMYHLPNLFLHRW
jgi:hypothetical protein